MSHARKEVSKRHPHWLQLGRHVVFTATITVKRWVCYPQLRDLDVMSLKLHNRHRWCHSWARTCMEKKVLTRRMSHDRWCRESAVMLCSQLPSLWVTAAAPHERDCGYTCLAPFVLPMTSDGQPSEKLGMRMKVCLNMSSISDDGVGLQSVLDVKLSHFYRCVSRL